jgi:AbrB family looped-hinge helix DNA binding protein
MPESHLTSKGQITLPKAIRDHLKVKRGDVVSFSVESDGRVTVSAVTAPVTSLKGMVAAPTVPVTVEAMQQAVRKRLRG